MIVTVVSLNSLADEDPDRVGAPTEEAPPIAAQAPSEKPSNELVVVLRRI